MRFFRGVSLGSLPGAFALASLFSASPAHAVDTTHIVERGHTLQAIANRYHVSVESIVKANHITSEKNLKVGETLIIPDVPKSGLPKEKAEPKPKEESKVKDPHVLASVKIGKDGKVVDPKKDPKKKEKPVTFAMRARTPGVVHIARLATKEDFAVRVREGGKIPASANRVFERLLRSTTGQAHAIDPRAMTLLANVSDHFGSRKIEVVSGYRPFRESQSTRHSKHNDGKAIDFRIVGVPNEVLRDYCKTLKNVGVGYYPNSVFVHMDAREAPAFWIDYSKPGEPARYHTPNADADEGANDIVEEDVKMEEPKAVTPDVDKPNVPMPLEKPEPPTPVSTAPVGSAQVGPTATR